MRRFATASLLVLVASATAATAAPIKFTAIDGTFQSFTAPTAGTYNIVAYGASGGSGLSPSGRNAGGLGAEIGGDFTLTAGEVLRIAVGTIGEAGTSNLGSASGGGGGGSFVVAPGEVPLVIAGGGGGGGSSAVGSPGLVTQAAGGAGVGGGTNGSGGVNNGGGGGGGFKSGSVSKPGIFNVGGNGYPPLPGYPSLQQGIGSAFKGADGGFGGGGGGLGGGGGGGGYSGGAGGFSGGGGFGGGSFDSGVNQVLLAGVNSGNGFVVINELSATPVPEPASLALLGVGLTGLLAARRRRG